MLATATAGALCVAAGGIRAARGAGLATPGPATGFGIALAALFTGGAFVAAGKYHAHTRHTDAPSAAVDRLRTATVTILFAASVAVPLVLIVLHRGASSQKEAVPAPSSGTDPFATPSYAPVPHTQQPTRSTGPHFDFNLLVLVLGAVLFVTVLVAAAVLVIRLLGDLEPDAPISGEPLAATPEDEAVLADAFTAGRRALNGGDARAAIIACYAAMEDSLGEAGVARHRSDSPSDLLRRAVDRDLLEAHDATVLTSLFREARYSAHPMGEPHLACAREALDAITAQLAQLQGPRHKAPAS